ncbi:MAG: type I secretion system permease/ATPase [Methylococcales bacterium]|nr:type I secretion system permease/ATPase [Methylococcales bacterium]
MSQQGVKSDLKKALWLCKGAFVSAMGFSMIINLLTLAPVVYMLQLYDRVITSGNQTTLIMLTLIMVVIFFTQGAIETIRTLILVRVSTRLETLLNKRLFRIAYKKSLYTGGQQASSQPLDDLTSLRQFLTGNGLFAFFDAPWMPIYLAIMFAFHPYFGYMAIFAAVFLSILALINEKVTRSVLAEANGLAAGNRMHLNKNLKNAEVIESMGMFDNIFERWLERSHKVLTLQAKASAKAGFLSSLSKTLRALFQSLTLGLGAYLAINQEINPSMMIAGSILLGKALAPIDQLIGGWKGFIVARTQYKRLNDLLINIPEDKDKMSLQAPKGQLQAEQAVIVPPGAKIPAVKGVSFTIEAGDTVGILGPSGAGKSSLARALLGIWPTSNGAIRLDGADIFDWDRVELGAHIGYLPQDIELFEGSISENISRFGEMDSDKIIEAAKMSGVHDMILHLPDGYDTMIGAMGNNLSGGQRQRVGLARAVYGNPKLIVLDEPNSNLDDSGEMALAHAIASLKAKKTTIIIVTHRHNILGQLNKLLLLQDGLVALYGGRDAVLAKMAEQQQQAAPPPPAPKKLPPQTFTIPL